MPRDFSNLRNKPRTVCFKCNSKQRYTNPMAQCWECRQKFCFDHIWSGQINDAMTENETVRDICDNCKKSKKYITMKT